GQELQALLGLGGFAFHILAYIESADLIQHRDSEGGLGMLHSNGHDAGVFALLAGADASLLTENGAQSTAFDHIEFGAVSRHQFSNLDLETVTVYGLAHRAVHQLLAIFIKKTIGTVFSRYQYQRLAQIGVRNLQLEDIEFLATPGETVKTKERVGHRLLRLRLEAAAHEGTNNREQVRLGNNSQLQVIHRLANYLARL